MIRGDRNRQTRRGSRTKVLLWTALVWLLSAAPAAAQVPAGCPGSLQFANIVEHDLNVSFCELCSVGDVRIVVENPFGPASSVGSFTNLQITEDLGASGLVYVPGSTQFSGNNIAVPADEEPTPPNGSVFTWDLTGNLTMNPIPGPGDATLFIDFQVTRPPASHEPLVSANRNITATVDLAPQCALDPNETFETSSTDLLPLNEPEPVVVKSGRNLDAGQGSGQYSNPVYGHADDDVIWRIEIVNGGDAPLQDFEFDDSMTPGNFRIDWVCDSEGAAVSASNGSPAGCVPPDTNLSVNDFDVAGAFASGPGPYIVAPANGSGFYYLVGEVISSCDDEVNTVSDVEWGCESDPGGPGGISQTSQNVGVPPASAELQTTADADGLDVDVFLEGVNLSQPMGARGTVTVRIRNLSGGTIKHEDGIRLRNVLPPEYVVDSTFDPILLRAPAYGSDYDGFVDTLEWLNPVGGTYPMATTNEALPLANTAPEFLLTSSEGQDSDTDKMHMIRHGDTVRIRFRTVLIDPSHYDLVADLDVRDEAPNSDPPGTDPEVGSADGDNDFPISNHAEIWFQEFCNFPTEYFREFDDNDTADPEDLDIDISGTELVFILTNTGDPLPLTVELTNRGGHQADDYQSWVTFGEAMTPTVWPPYCSQVSDTDPYVVWQNPTGLPGTATVFACDPGVIGPGNTVFMNFEVVKNTAASFDDDLTFRADVIGEIWLSDDVPQPDGSTGRQLWFPSPVARPDGVTDRANNYSIDSVWARVVGYNLFKTQVGTCTENNPPPVPPGDPDDEIQIGEECTFHIESGGWFGFRTPGFQYIAVQDVEVVDDLALGQGYISSTDPLLTSTSAILGVSLNPPPTVLDDSDFDWTFNTLVPDERITEKDHWFRADVTTRMLNDPIDASNPPNEHDALSFNVLTSTFQAVFFNDSTGMEEVYDLGPSTLGFPREVHRRVDLTVTEPNLVVQKEVCNETLYGAGVGCTNFTDLADDGDAFDSYVFRITITNEAEAGDTAPRAPAYDVTVTSEADVSDLLEIIPLAADTVDNDGDADVDAGDLGGEGTITDNLTQNGTPANVIASYTHSDALLRIDPGEVVTFYYRVDPDDDAAPLQLFNNRARATYDSLEGSLVSDSGNQTPPLGAHGEIGGARQYTSEYDDAEIRIVPVETIPKQITALSNTPLSAPVTPQPVSIGEEIEFELHALLPVAQLRQFVIEDQLPAGITCSEALEVVLPTSAFDPGGGYTPTCTDTEVVWDFGDQTVKTPSGGMTRYDLAVRFIARVDNILANQDGQVITNGGASTTVEVRYIDEADVGITIPIDSVSVVVQEPLIELQKAFSVATTDAGDVPQVTVTATNNGSATAYNLRVLDDLTLVGLSYAGNLSGADPPTADLATFGPDAPLFIWPGGIAIAPGESLVFTFDVSVDITVQPLEVLPNTIQADWTSLPGQDTALNSIPLIGPDGSPTGMRNGALPNAGDDLNDYEAEAQADMSVPPLTIQKIDVDPAFVPAIGAHKPFEVVISLPEGTTQALTATDDLASGGVSYVLSDNADFDVLYSFTGIASINGQPPSEAAFTAVPPDAASGTAVWTVGTVVTDSEDDLTASALDPEIRITYWARVNNDLVTDSGDTLQNGLEVTYTNGETGTPEVLNDATPPIVAIEPDLTATKTLTNVTPGKAAGDPPALNDILQYVVTVPNGPEATAYDVNIVDTLPPEVVLYGGFTPTAAINSAVVSGFVATPAGAPAGPLVWGRQNGDDSLDIPPTQALVLTYQVQVTSVLNATTIENEIWVDWTSLDLLSDYERTGDGCPVTTPPNDYCFGPAVAVGTADPLPPVALTKSITQDTASIGEPFTYEIRVPAVDFAYDLYDVRVFDDLGTSGRILRFLSVTETAGLVAINPVNTGSPTNLVIEDTGGGIDIPAGQHIVLEVTVVLEDAVENFDGATFTNTASWFWNVFDDDTDSQIPGLEGTSELMTVVEPDLVMDKSGPDTMTIGTPETFTLDLQNVGDGPAWNVTLTDLLPDTPNGGTCGTAPTAFTAEVFQSNGSTSVSGPLGQGSDFTVVYDGPSCLLTLQFLTPQTTIGSTERLIVTYDVQLDAGTQDGTSLTNYAGAVEWYSWEDTSPDRRTYTDTVTDGTPGDDDPQDLHTLDVTLPGLLFEKTVVNQDTGADPATTASPGDILVYTLRIENLSDVPVLDFSVVDDLGSQNPTIVYAPNTLVVSTPSGTDNSSPIGGSNNTGLVDVSGLSLPGSGDSIEIQFQIQLAAVIPDGTAVTNQSQIRIDDTDFLDSDDPNVNGPALPDVPDDEDPTVVLIQSAPQFVTEKTSAYLDGDPNVLLAGERLRYTITVANVGTDDAIDVTIRDAIPTNTSYVPGSTTLNGAAVPDVGGLSPLAAGMPINAPSAGAGMVPADSTQAAINTATIVFDVLVDANVVDGTIISNQAFVTTIPGGVVDDPSDDPDTPIVDDPTRDVVGNLPLLFAAKDVVLLNDANLNAVVDPGDTLQYTITVVNSGAVPATNAVLQDALPANTNYMVGTTTLNGEPVPDGGAFPLVAGLPISSSDLTPPLPGPGAGTINPGQAATIVFVLEVDPLTTPGTIISNQATLQSDPLPDLLTDGDGNPATGPEPTVVVVGPGQQLSITKQVAVVGGGAALPGSTLEYVVTVRNIAAVPAAMVVITDDLNPLAGQLSLTGTPTLNGSTTGVTVPGGVLTADYSGSYGDLAAGGSAVLRFQAVIDPGLPMGTTITNTAVVTWNDPPQTADASVSIDVGGMPGVGLLSGTVWHDADFDLTADVGERLLQSWSVDLYRNGAPLISTLTDASGAYSIGGLTPNDVGTDQYELRFRAPGSGANTASMGTADSPFTNGPQQILDIVVPSGSNLLDLDLPITPNGVIYDVLLRAPVSGAAVTLTTAGGAPLSSACFEDPVQQMQLTTADGWYKFDLNFDDGSCPEDGDYLIAVAPPGGGFAAGYSQIIPPTSGPATPPLVVPSCPGGANDAVIATGQHCESQPSEFAPPPSIPAQDPATAYHVHLSLNESQPPGSSQIFNNHIPIDPVLNGSVAVVKTTPNINVSRGQLVPYEITVVNALGADIVDLGIVDRFPAGFHYVEGSARIDGVPTEPIINGRELVWNDVGIAAASQRTLVLLLVVGAGVTDGEYVNRAYAISSASGVPISGEAFATVRVVPDPTFACTDVVGKVFDDANRNGLQDSGERGLQGVRLMTTTGLVATTDQHGRYHFTCALTPNESRGSNFVLKLDDRTLPSGYRMSTRQVLVGRATAGKALRFNYAASIHRVVSLDMADAVFEPGTTRMRAQWKPRLQLLLSELKKAPSVLRLSYVADVEGERLVEDRLDAVKSEISAAWKELPDVYPLEIEPEIFWRRGAPVDVPARRAVEDR